MTRVLVTGANGHLGSHIVRCLLKHGHEVVPFVRHTSNQSALEGLNLSCRYGDILDLPSLKAAMTGCEGVIHSAAVYKMWVKDPAEVIEPALKGTDHVFRAAAATGVRRIVYTSSSFAVGATTDPSQVRTPADWNTEIHLPYTGAKVESEKLAWRLAEETGIDLITLCPDGILGPLDFGITPSTILLRDLANGRGITNPIGISFVDVRDVAEIHARAVDQGEPGQRYIVAGEPMMMRELGQIVTRLTGVKPRHLGFGRPVFWLIAGLMELGAAINDSPPLLTRQMVLELVGRHHFYDTSKTEQAFGVVPRPAEEMVADAIQWLIELGQVQPKLSGRPSLDQI